MSVVLTAILRMIVCTSVFFWGGECTLEERRGCHKSQANGMFTGEP